MKILLIVLSYILVGCLVCADTTKKAIQPKGKWILVLFWPAFIIMLLAALLVLGFVKLVNYIGDCVLSWTKKIED